MRTIQVQTRFKKVEASIKIYEAKNWVYLYFTSIGKNSRMCLDQDGNIVKGQSHSIPEVFLEERQRIVREVLGK